MLATNRRRWTVTLALVLIGPLVARGQERDDKTEQALAAEAETRPEAPPHRVFADSVIKVDEALSRPYSPEVPFGGVGARVWASSPQGWAFADDVHWVYLTNIPALDLRVRDAGGLLRPTRATYFPSHVHLEGAERSAVASASFTFRVDSVQAPLSKPFDPSKRWTCWSSGSREDWYAVDFGAPRTLSGLAVHFFDDTGSGSVRPPKSFAIEAWEGDAWKPVAVAETKPRRPARGENTITFAAPVTSDRFRLVLQHAGAEFYSGIYGFEAIGEGATPPVSLAIEGDKFITADDILLTTLRVTNPGSEPATVEVMPVTGWQGQQDYRWLSDRVVGKEGPAGVWSLEGNWRTRYYDFDVAHRLRFAVHSDPPKSQPIQESLKVLLADSNGMEDNAAWLRESAPLTYALAPGETKVFKAALELKRAEEPSTLDDVLVAATAVPRIRRRERGETARYGNISPDKQDTRDPLAAHVASYEQWFGDNLAYFDCSDPFVRKMYYHRAYTMRKNMINPKLGVLKYPTQAEGRWRSTWYPNVISYGAGHQIREARWLRDPAYWRGHLQTWAENEKADGVYPSHIRPEGPAGGQYADWITATAWDGHLVHPSAEFLAPLADKLAANVRGWQKVYDTDGDGLLLVDSHWWTGMEYQPSFFYFSDFQTSADFYQPAEPVSLERVDLTAYNYGNAVAVAKLYRALNQADKAEEFDDLAAKIAGAVREKMWRPEQGFFYSLRADDDAVADVKEIIGVYPFYFGMLPAGEGYEATWASVLDPEQFWTPWPVASASKQTPAYSQTGWPQADGRASTCMWNGPTWPHANSIVLTAMARTIRSDRTLEGEAKEKASPLTPEKFYELFESFTKAQYLDQDLTYPWTGEFYNGETAEWKTRERDYNHSTWLDVLIPDVLGLVPREDDILEIDPLFPADKFAHALLDGQQYRGHDVTIAWDAPGDGEDAYGDGREGFDVYLDGKLAASADAPSRLQVDLKTGQPVGGEQKPGEAKPTP